MFTYFPYIPPVPPNPAVAVSTDYSVTAMVLTLQKKVEDLEKEIEILKRLIINESEENA